MDRLVTDLYAPVGHQSEQRLGPLFADIIRRNRPKPGDRWFLDLTIIKMRGDIFYLWRAVDQHGDVLDILVQKRPSRKAATRFVKKLVATFGDAPRVLVTDKLRSYGAARKGGHASRRSSAAQMLRDAENG